MQNGGPHSAAFCFKNDGLHANCLVATVEKVGWFWCVSGWELTKTTGSRASAHVVAFCFLIRNWHKQMSPFNPTTLEELQGHCA